MLIVLIIILLAGAAIFMFTRKHDDKEARYAAGMNFDLEKVAPFLKHLSFAVLDSGFNQTEINSIMSKINTMKHNEVKEIGTFDVMYKGKPAKIRIEAEVHIEDDLKEVVLYMFSIQELVDLIDQEMLKTEEAE